MQKEAKINFYRIAKCGYYRRGDPAAEFGDIAATLSDLHRWITNDQPTVRETQTFNPSDDGSILPVFCYGIQRPRNGTDYLLTTWNETDTANGQFASLYADQTAGNAAVDATTIPAGTVPGFPTYFWFIPDRGLVATIRFENRLNGHQGLDLYMRGFLERFAGWVVTQNNQPRSLTVEILGYSQDADGDPARLRPDFQSVPVRKQGEIDLIRANRENIRKIIRTDEYEMGRAEPRNFLRAALQALGLRGDPQPLPDTRYRCEFTYQPTEDELNEIIDHWSNNHATRWDDVGFQFTGGDDVKWLSRASAKDKLLLDVDYKNDVVVDDASLLAALNRERTRLLALVGDEAE